MKQIFCIAAAAFTPLLASLIYFDILDGSPAAKYIYALSKVFILLWPALCAALFIKGINFKPAFKWDFKEFLTGLACGVLIFCAGLLLYMYPPAKEIIHFAAPAAAAKAQNFGVGGYFIIFALLFSFLHAMLEEYYWRFFTYGQIAALTNKYAAHILAGAAFTLHHFIVLKLYYPLPYALLGSACVFAGGIIFSLLYARKNNIYGAWAAHVMADLIIFYIGYKMLF